MFTGSFSGFITASFGTASGSDVKCLKRRTLKDAHVKVPVFHLFKGLSPTRGGLAFAPTTSSEGDRIRGCSRT